MKEMSQHNYTNPAFCQQSEFYSSATSSPVKKISPVKVHRSASTRSIFVHQQQQQRSHVRNQIGNSNSQLLNYSASLTTTTPPKPGPKPIVYGETQIIIGHERSKNGGGSGRYAIVPIEDLSQENNGKYAVLPVKPNLSNLVKSQQNLDLYSSQQFQTEEPRSLDSSTRYSSLPPVPSPNEPPPRLKHAFSSDFGSKSFVIVDQKSQQRQRYEIVPTEDDEELVDDNHEIIQMHNGRAHRYAMIPTEEEMEEIEEETCLDNRQIEQQSPSTRYGYATITENRKTTPNLPLPQCHSTPQKSYSTITTPNRIIQTPNTPKKNLATQRLHDYLKTPTKMQQTRNFTPQKLQYDHNLPQQPHHQQHQPRTPQPISTIAYQMEKRTTAVISPRLMAPSIYSETTSESANKSWNNLSFQKLTTNGTITIGIISLMLVICGILNTALTIYLIYHVSYSHIRNQKFTVTIFCYLVSHNSLFVKKNIFLLSILIARLVTCM